MAASFSPGMPPPHANDIEGEAEDLGKTHLAADAARPPGARPFPSAAGIAVPLSPTAVGCDDEPDRRRLPQAAARPPGEPRSSTSWSAVASLDDSDDDGEFEMPKAFAIPPLPVPVEVEKEPEPTIPSDDASWAQEGLGPSSGGSADVDDDDLRALEGTIRGAIAKAYNAGITCLRTLVAVGIESVEHHCRSVGDIENLETRIQKELMSSNIYSFLSIDAHDDASDTASDADEFASSSSGTASAESSPASVRARSNSIYRKSWASESEEAAGTPLAHNPFIICEDSPCEQCIRARAHVEKALSIRSPLSIQADLGVDVDASRMNPFGPRSVTVVNDSDAGGVRVGWTAEKDAG